MGKKSKRKEPKAPITKNELTDMIEDRVNAVLERNYLPVSYKFNWRDRDIDYVTHRIEEFFKMVNATLEGFYLQCDDVVTDYNDDSEKPITILYGYYRILEDEDQLMLVSDIQWDIDQINRLIANRRQ